MKMSHVRVCNLHVAGNDPSPLPKRCTRYSVHKLNTILWSTCLHQPSSMLQTVKRTTLKGRSCYSEESLRNDYSIARKYVNVLIV